jgi:hypothetical protein
VPQDSPPEAPAPARGTAFAEPGRVCKPQGGTMFAQCKVAALSLALFSGLAPISRADGFGITWMQRFHHGVLSLGFSSAPGSEPRCAPACWVPGHYETVYRQVWVEGCAERVWTPPLYAWRTYGCGRLYRACVRPGGFEIVRREGRYESRPFQVWVEGAWRSA